MKKIEPIAGTISLVLGIVSIITLYWGIGVFVAIIGIIFGCIGYGYDNSKIARIEEFFNTFNALIIDDHKFAIGKTHIMQSIEFI